jgi:hypothetical protein
MTVIATHPQEAVFEATTLEIGVKFLMHMQGQAFTLCIKLFNQGWVVFLNKFVEKRLLGAMAFVSGVTKGILTWQEHTEWTPTSTVLKSHTVKQSLQTWNIEIGQEQISATDYPVATVMIRVRRPRTVSRPPTRALAEIAQDRTRHFHAPGGRLL